MPDDSRLPAVSRPPGLPAAPQGYLYERIKSYVDLDMRDLVCPHPEGDVFNELPPAQCRRIEAITTDEEDEDVIVGI